MRLFCPSCGRPTRDVDEADRVARCGTCGDFAYAPPSADPPPAGDRTPPPDLVLDDEPAVPLPAGFVDDGRTLAWRQGATDEVVTHLVGTLLFGLIAGAMAGMGAVVLARVVIDGQWSGVPFMAVWTGFAAVLTGLAAWSAWIGGTTLLARPRLTLGPGRATFAPFRGRERGVPADAVAVFLRPTRRAVGKNAVDLLARDAAGHEAVLARRLPSREAGRFLLQRIERHLGLPPRRVPGGLR